MKPLLCTFLVLVVALLLAGCVAGTKVRTAPDPGDPIANQPKVCVGDKWVYEGWSQKEGTDTWTGIVDKVNEDGSYETIWSSKKGKEKDRDFYNSMGLNYKTIDLNTGKVTFESELPKKGMEYPVFVGKQWDSTWSGTSFKGERFRYYGIFNVTDYQRIKVKAGEFDVFRIYEAQKVTSGNNRLVNQILYYSPQVKRNVLTKPTWREGSELIEYSVSICE